MPGQRVHHPLHHHGHRVVRREVVALEQRIEHRLGDQVLGQHGDRVRGGDAVVEVGPQRRHERVELLRDLRGGILGDQGGDPLGVLGRHLRNGRGPVLPVLAVPHLLHDLGVDGVPPLLRILERQVQHGLLAVLVGGDHHRGVVVHGHRDHVQAVVPVLVEVDVVDHRLETVVVRAQRVEHGPDDLVLLAVLQCGLRRHPGGDAHRQDDVPVVLVLGPAHHPPHGLHHVHLRVAGVEEHHRVQAGNVHALGETPRVGEDAALVLLRLRLQPPQLAAPLRHVHGAVHVLGAQQQILRVVLRELLAHPLQRVSNPLRLADVGGERHRAPHGSRGTRARSGVVPAARGGTARGQALPAADHAGDVVNAELAVLVREQLLELARDRGLVHREHQDLVVAEQTALHGLAEAQAVELGAEQCCVVHGRDHHGVLLRLLPGALVEHARRGRHVEALGAADEGPVVDAHERGVLLTGQRGAGGAVGLVADDQVEVREAHLLRLVQHVDGLVRGEHHGAARVVREAIQLSDQTFGARGGRQRQVRGGDVIRGALAHLHVRAHRERAELLGGVPLPLGERLGQQGDGGHQEQHRGVLRGLLLHDLQ